MSQEATPATLSPSATAPEQQQHRRRRYKRLTAAEWGEVCALYGTGDLTLAELSEQFGVSIRSIQNHLRQTGTVKGATAQHIIATAKAKVAGSVLPCPATLADKIRDTKDSIYADTLLIQRALIARVNAVLDGSAGVPFSAQMRMIEQAASTLDRLSRTQWKVLGLDKPDAEPGELPELPIRELTDIEVAEIRAKQVAEGRALVLQDGCQDGEFTMEDDDVVEEGVEEEAMS